MTKSLGPIYAAIVLNAVGIGLIFPILPTLLRDVTGTADVAPYIGVLAALYAVMQFLFSPVLGALSDRLGRRPVLLMSLAGAAIDYLFLAFAPSLWMLFIGRALAGLTSATTSVAAAYITDLSSEDQRPARFGMLNAMFGAGFVIGPLLGGSLGDYWHRLPFLVAAGLNGVNLIVAFLALPESCTASPKARIDMRAFNPLKPLTWAFSMRAALPIIFVFFVFSATGESYAVAWALWGRDEFGWSGFWIGLSLGTYGLLQALVQAFLPGRAAKLLGERPAILTGLACSSLALTVMAFADQTWMVFVILPMFALGGIGVPALQSLATRQVPLGKQGEFQGVLASAVSMASIVAPLGFSNLYFITADQWPGAIWLAVFAIQVIAAILVLALRSTPLPDKNQLSKVASERV